MDISLQVEAELFLLDRVLSRYGDIARWDDWYWVYQMASSRAYYQLMEWIGSHRDRDCLHRLRLKVRLAHCSIKVLRCAIANDKTVKVSRMTKRVGFVGECNEKAMEKGNDGIVEICDAIWQCREQCKKACWRAGDYIYV